MHNWDHLPNVLRVGSVLTDVRARPGIWAAAPILRNMLWLNALSAAEATARRARRDREITRAGGIASAVASATVNLDEGTDKVWIVVHEAIRAALYALVAWDESATLLDLTPDALRTIIHSCEGDVKHQAVLLLPAVIARHTP